MARIRVVDVFRDGVEAVGRWNNATRGSRELNKAGSARRRIVPQFFTELFLQSNTGPLSPSALQPNPAWPVVVEPNPWHASTQALAAYILTSPFSIGRFVTPGVCSIHEADHRVLNMAANDLFSTIQVQSFRLEPAMAQSIQREAEHAASGAGDCEGSLLDNSATLPPGFSAPTASQPSFDLKPPQAVPHPIHERKKISDKIRRGSKRAKARKEQPGRPRSSQSKKYARPLSIVVNFNALKLATARGGFVSRRQRCERPGGWTLDELASKGFKVIEWDG
ncbi:hypothetical protein HYDPIDRAFT_142656, partial [Hydnomerulius pinastri MD-312]